MNDLLKEIDKQCIISRSPDKYITHRGLRQHIFTKNINHIYASDLPICASLGAVFLIKGNNIIEFYSYADSHHSPHVQVNYKIPTWIGTISPINIEPGDPENINYILDKQHTFYYSENYIYLILELIKNGFKVYVKD